MNTIKYSDTVFFQKLFTQVLKHTVHSVKHTNTIKYSDTVLCSETVHSGSEAYSETCQTLTHTSVKHTDIHH